MAGIQWSVTIWSAVCLQMLWNCSNNQRPGNGRNSMKHDQKLIRAREVQNEFAHIWWEQLTVRLPTKSELNMITVSGIAQLCDLYVPFSLYYYNFMCFYVKKKKIDNFMCLLEFECAKRLKAHSRAIPAVFMKIIGHIRHFLINFVLNPNSSLLANYARKLFEQ